MQFCADLVEKRLSVQEYVSLGPVLDRATGSFSTAADVPWTAQVQPTARALWDVVQASRLDVARSNPATPVAAANAITILNAAGIIFDHCNLSHATLGPVQAEAAESTTKFFAVLSGAVLSHADLSYACLTKANLSSACLDHAQLGYANMLDVEFGQRAMLLGHTDSVTSVAVSSDGKYVVSGSEDKSVKIWSTETGDVVQSLTGHTDGVLSVAVSSDGKYVVSGSWDNSVKIWSTKTGDVVWTLTGHTSDVSSVTVSSDGKYVVSGSGDKSVKIWSTETGDVVRTLTGHTSDVSSVAVSSDGKYVVSGSKDYSVKIWSTDGSRVPYDLLNPTVPDSHRGTTASCGHYRESVRSVVWCLAQMGNT